MIREWSERNQGPKVKEGVVNQMVKIRGKVTQSATRHETSGGWSARGATYKPSGLNASGLRL